jgi:hypothetical protein
MGYTPGMETGEYMALALDLAKRSGAIMRKNFMLSMKKEWKDDRSPVTETYLTINDLVIK